MRPFLPFSRVRGLSRSTGRIPGRIAATGIHTSTYYRASQSPRRRRSSGVAQQKPSEVSLRRTSAVSHRRRSSGHYRPSASSRIPLPQKVFPAPSPKKPVARLSPRSEAAFQHSATSIHRGRPILFKKDVAWTKARPVERKTFRSGKTRTGEIGDDPPRLTQTPQVP